MADPKDDDIDYTAEGATPPHEKDDPTNEGYDEAAHTGTGRYGVAEGEGGVFGTTGGGTFAGGMHVESRPTVGNDSSVKSDDKQRDDQGPPAGGHGPQR